MIKVNELRIGNLMYENNCGYLKISSINERLVLAHTPRMVTNGCFYLNSIGPIQLTEEILLKCGFERFGKSLRLNIFEYCTLSKNLVIHGHGGYYTGLIFKIQYIHQLQNLYFAITGEELTIKL